VQGPVPALAVVVDDVATTGATLSACARALRAAGARDVRGLAYARTPGR
jgi:predicted amidophosphoribosyltransferase